MFLIDFRFIVLVKKDYPLLFPAYFNLFDFLYHQVVQAAILFIHNPVGVKLLNDHTPDTAPFFQYDFACSEFGMNGTYPGDAALLFIAVSAFGIILRKDVCRYAVNQEQAHYAYDE